MFIFSSFCDFLALVLNIHAGEDFFFYFIARPVHVSIGPITLL